MAPVRGLKKLLLAAALIFSAYVILKLLFQLQTGFCDGLSFLAATSFCHGSSAPPKWNMFYHLGGNGPWIPKRNSPLYDDVPLPKGCQVDQVHMLSRHAERYPTRNAGARHFDLLDRLNAPGVVLSGKLAFLKSWKYFTDPSNPDFENLTAVGPYAGTVQSLRTGEVLRRRYRDLVPTRKQTRFWSCGSGRDVETARYFGDGFFGPSWEQDGSAVLEVIAETEDRGADTLTPGDTCIKYVNDTEYGHDYGYHMLAEWQNVFTEHIIARLKHDALGVSLSALDIYGMMELCGFEILVRGASPWCDVFSREEWLDFEYGRDLLHFYRAGPGNKYAGAMGWLWLNATQELLGDQTSNDFYFSFVHDGDIVPVLATLQVLNEDTTEQELPSMSRKSGRRWQTSDVVPMRGRLIFERISCSTSGKADERFVRLFINDGLMQMPKVAAANKIDRALPLKDFRAWIQSLEARFGTFREVCGLETDAPQRITFLHQ